MKPIKATLHEDLILLEARIKLFLSKSEYQASYADLKEVARHYLKKHRVGDQFFSTWLQKLAKNRVLIINQVKGKLYYENFEMPEQTLSGNTKLDELKKSNNPAILELLAGAERLKIVQQIDKEEREFNQVPKQDGFGHDINHEEEKETEPKRKYPVIPVVIDNENNTADKEATSDELLHDN